MSSRQDPWEQSMPDAAKLAAAYHLAIGSRDTATDLSKQLAKYHTVVTAELVRFAENFQRISELLVEAGFRP